MFPCKPQQPTPLPSLARTNPPVPGFVGAPLGHVAGAPPPAVTFRPQSLASTVPAMSARRQTQLSAAAGAASLTVSTTPELGEKGVYPGCATGVSTVNSDQVNSDRVVVSFYKFADLSPDSHDFLSRLQDYVDSQADVAGFILVAQEGINGNMGGPRDSVDRVFDFIENDPRLLGLRKNYTPVTETSDGGDVTHGASGRDEPFRWEGVRVRHKTEIVTMGVPGVNPSRDVGTYIGPGEWNDLISDPDTIVVDVRNHYETRLGRFRNAVDPRTHSFREFPKWVHQNLLSANPAHAQDSAEEQGRGQVAEGFGRGPVQDKTEPLQDKRVPLQDKKVAMYCTGGIRCEKATAFLRSLGFEKVYHLEGGILSYLRKVPPSQSLWDGECFVFDKRVAVKNGLLPGSFRLCYACKEPVDDADVASEWWEEGVSCPHCFHRKSEEEKGRARARQRQFEMWGRVGGPGRAEAHKHRKLRTAKSL